jgi:hypothetical protein
MASGVFVLKDEDTLVSMASAQFASEAIFQRLLAKFPELLSGDQIDPASPRKWILVRREKAVPADDNGGGRWSLDHLFLDQDGVPTLVELKRQTDTRIRREVVGQMLDYAANCVVYWPVEGLRADLESTQGRSSSEALIDFLGPELNEGAYWQQVKTNLEAGRIRLLFVADAIPPELRRIIEFLNKQMDPAEVLGLELRQFQGEGLRTIVPLVVGQTQEASQKRSLSASGKLWDEGSIFAELRTRCSESEMKVAVQIAEWMRKSGAILDFGRGQRSGSMIPVFTNKKNGIKFYPVILWSYGKLEIQFQWMKERPFFSNIENRRQLFNRLNAIDGVSIPEDDISKRPSISLSILASSPSRLTKLLETLAWAAEQFMSA